MDVWKWEAEGQPKAVVVVIHNAYEHHSRHAWLIQRLRSSGFHVVTGDLPGHGMESVRSVHDEKFTLYNEFVKKLLTIGLNDSLPMFVIGHGLGATLMIRMLQQEKIECAGFISSSPWLGLKHQPAKLSAMLTKLSATKKLNHEITIEMLTRSYETYIESRQDRKYTPMVTATWYRELQAYMKTVMQHEGTIQNIPVLLHVAGNDKITDTTYAKKWLVNQGLTEFQFKEWKRLYHDLYLEPEREEVYLYTEAFMDNVLRSLGYIV